MINIIQKHTLFSPHFSSSVTHRVSPGASSTRNFPSCTSAKPSPMGIWSGATTAAKTVVEAATPRLSKQGIFIADLLFRFRQGALT